MNHTIAIELKWSAWSADPETFEERPRGAEFIELLKAGLAGGFDETGDSIEVATTSRKESRSGTVSFRPADGRLHVGVWLADYWDAPHDLLGTIHPDADELTDDDDAWHRELEALEEALPYVGWSGEPGHYVETSLIVEATPEDPDAALRELLARIDQEEDRLLTESAALWDDLVTLYARPELKTRAS
ncbi:MAG TPA: hypothetical protein VFH61_08480 [Thermoleophilia bacterium]|nr:hypothetical protein [Thermoleophilia bacterium]